MKRESLSGDSDKIWRKIGEKGVTKIKNIKALKCPKIHTMDSGLSEFARDRYFNSDKTEFRIIQTKYNRIGVQGSKILIEINRKFG